MSPISGLVVLGNDKGPHKGNDKGPHKGNGIETLLGCKAGVPYGGVKLGSLMVVRPRARWWWRLWTRRGGSGE